jgi:hypothetical protein
VNRIAGAATLGALIGLGPTAPPAHAGFIATILQEGSNVVVTGHGSIDLSGLTFFETGSNGAALVDRF